MTYLFLKVLDADMQSCNGGKMRWKLYKWKQVLGDLEICSRGLHLTTEPSKWNGRRIFIAETEKVYGRSEDKRLCRRVRLLKELSPKELTWYGAKLKPIDEDYEAKRKTINEDYEAKRKTIDEDYEAKLKPIDEDYEAKRKPIDEDYEAKLKPIDEDYEAKLKPIDEDYEAKLKPINEDYEAKLKPINEDYEAKRKTINEDYEAKLKPINEDYYDKAVTKILKVLLNGKVVLDGPSAEVAICPTCRVQLERVKEKRSTWKCPRCGLRISPNH